jgi:hypothetical protein
MRFYIQLFGGILKSDETPKSDRFNSIFG